MASSNRHWPSMFKSKPNLTPWHLNCHTSSFPQGCNEERTPDPKPRWNPRPEQIRILESIFNSGMVNPPRDEIRKIRAQLQEFGQVGDANVFYWFQNRKSRSKNKLRQLQNPKPRPPSSSSSSDKSSSASISSNEKTISVSTSTLMDLLNSPTASVNQPFFQAASTSSQFLNEPAFFDSSSLGQGFGFADQESVVNCSNVLLGDDQLMLMNHGPLRKVEDEHVAPHESLSLTSTTTSHILQAGPDLGQTVPEKMTVFINDVCFEVATSRFNVREAFGDDSVLIQSSGQPILTNEWGVTQQPLQHGAFYYVVPANFTPSPEDRKV